MKTMNLVLKVLTALAAVAGAVYVVATYGDKIVDWAKKLWAAMPKCPCTEEAPVVEEVPAEEEAPAAEEVQEEPAVEVTVDEAAENAPVAEDDDFEA